MATRGRKRSATKRSPAKRSTTTAKRRAPAVRALSRAAGKAGQTTTIHRFARRQLKTALASGLSRKAAVAKVVALRGAVAAAQKANPKLTARAARAQVLGGKKSGGATAPKSGTPKGLRSGTPAKLRSGSGSGKGAEFNRKHPRAENGKFASK